MLMANNIAKLPTESTEECQAFREREFYTQVHTSRCPGLTDIRRPCTHEGLTDTLMLTPLQAHSTLLQAHSTLLQTQNTLLQA